MMVTMVPDRRLPTLEALGVGLRPVQESIGDTLRWLGRGGLIPPDRPSGAHDESEEGSPCE